MTNAIFAPDMMEGTIQRALMSTLERLLDSACLHVVWPAAFDLRKAGTPMPPSEVRIVVLPLDRIGAPAGASGANVYISYYSPAPGSGPISLASPPLVVKIGPVKKLQEEIDGVGKWPTLSQQDRERFALPIHLDLEDADWAVLIAPFHSTFGVTEEGTGNTIEVRDLWQLLENKSELLSVDADHWEKIRSCVEDALDAIQPLHRAALARRERVNRAYGTTYERYMRRTIGTSPMSHIPRLIFGSSPVVKAFGRDWDNPVLLVEELVSGREFSGVFGAVHGDLHPKNIVLNQKNAARIIDFGWAKGEAHIVQDYVLLDLNIRGTTLPSQLSEADILALAAFLFPDQDVADLPELVQPRAKIIKEVIWQKAKSRAVEHWKEEYLIPLLLVGYGLLVHLDSARNQPALVATVLAVTCSIRAHEKAVTT